MKSQEECHSERSEESSPSVLSGFFTSLTNVILPFNKYHINQMDDNFYIFGRNTVIEALSGNAEIEKIFISYGSHGDTVKHISALAKKKKIPCSLQDKRKFAQLEKTSIPAGAKTQGIIALIRRYKSVELNELIELSKNRKGLPLIVALDKISDPQNLGAIARSVECAGGSGIILPNRDCAPVSPVAIKASAGALEHLPVAKTNNLQHSLDKCKESGFWVFGADSNADNYYTEKMYDVPVVLVIGSEGKGISSGIAKACDKLIKIPIMGKVDSLNASVATAVILFEIIRQRTIDKNNL
ncbi:MAG: rlmB [Ignavibacteria bacterium]|nr:rlmB [Ignavibacteria bacterium]